MLTSSYSIEDLADETGFDKRVIRSFIEQGLLAGPDSKGRYARYTSSHLIRLRAIKLLRDNRQMTLSEIRAALLSMTEEDINALSTKAALHDEQRAEPLKSSVLDYLRTARHLNAYSDMDKEVDSEMCSARSAHRSLAQGLSALNRLQLVLQDSIGNKRSNTYGKGQLCHRFAVTPDIEITVRGLQDGGQVEQWERISDCLREILLGGCKNE